MKQRILDAIYRFFYALEAIPVCAEDCDCPEHYLEDLGVTTMSREDYYRAKVQENFDALNNINNGKDNQ